ncbi:MAG TPA: hypothetical protein VF355_05480 [Anaerolineaceae bacterium]
MKPAALSGAADPLLATQAIHPNLPFVDFVSSAQQAVERASLRFPGSAEVLVFPHGGSTYPILP